ncbi:MAG: hypothetical protein K6A65_05535, partial [Succinivibrionaceae bacterium]|nr:hypothetical protein [Succinivibrionaceae bacterium]
MDGKTEAALAVELRMAARGRLMGAAQAEIHELRRRMRLPRAAHEHEVLPLINALFEAVGPLPATLALPQGEANSLLRLTLRIAIKSLTLREKLAASLGRALHEPQAVQSRLCLIGALSWALAHARDYEVLAADGEALDPLHLSRAVLEQAPAPLRIAGRQEGRTDRTPGGFWGLLAESSARLCLRDLILSEAAPRALRAKIAAFLAQGGKANRPYSPLYAVQGGALLVSGTHLERELRRATREELLKGLPAGPEDLDSGSARLLLGSNARSDALAFLTSRSRAPLRRLSIYGRAFYVRGTLLRLGNLPWMHPIPCKGMSAAAEAVICPAGAMVSRILPPPPAPRGRPLAP